MQTFVPWGAAPWTISIAARPVVGRGNVRLPEFFGAVHGKHPAVTIRDFHDGLRRLADNHAIQLMLVVWPRSDPAT